jgi:hypothetical protein
MVRTGKKTPLSAADFGLNTGRQRAGKVYQYIHIRHKTHISLTGQFILLSITLSSPCVPSVQYENIYKLILNLMLAVRTLKLALRSLKLAVRTVASIFFFVERSAPEVIDSHSS